VEALLARGAERVYAAARRIDALADAVENHGDRVVPIQLDVTDEETVRRLADDLPDVDVMVSNAGRPCKLPVLQDQAEQEFRSAMEVNFFEARGSGACFRAPPWRGIAGASCSSNPWRRSSSREARRSTVRARPRP
jgi:NAD(P)-dependent dehydrogenase (short-subunit alcohol dehydrogenase family)